MCERCTISKLLLHAVRHTDNGVSLSTEIQREVCLSLTICASGSMHPVHRVNDVRTACFFQQLDGALPGNRSCKRRSHWRCALRTCTSMGVTSLRWRRPLTRTGVRAMSLLRRHALRHWGVIARRLNHPDAPTSHHSRDVNVSESFDHENGFCPSDI